MACLAADGSPTETGRRILAAVATPATALEAAAATGLAPYRVRAALRELAAAGLVRESGDGRFAAADAGPVPT